MPVAVGPQLHEGGPTHGLAPGAVVLVDSVCTHRSKADASDVVPDVADVTLDLRVENQLLKYLFQMSVQVIW